jgi:SnoaL-like domain
MIHAPFASTQHATRSHHVAVDGDSASCLSYVHARFIRDVPEGGDMFESTGWYEDVLSRTAAGWRIAHRKCRMNWWGGNPAVLQTTPAVNIAHVLDSLFIEASAGKIAHLDNVRRQSR